MKELNYMEILNTIVLYFFSVLMLLKTNNPWNPEESGIYLTPEQSESLSKIFKFSIMIFSAINLLNLLKDHL